IGAVVVGHRRSHELYGVRSDLGDSAADRARAVANQNHRNHRQPGNGWREVSEYSRRQKNADVANARLGLIGYALTDEFRYRSWPNHVTHTASTPTSISPACSTS